MPKKPTIADRWDAKAKLACVIQTASMNEAERATYCREHGLYPEQLNDWRLAFESMDTAGPADRAALANERHKSKQFEQSPAKALAATLRSWLEPIVRMWRFTQSNGITEGFHTKMEMLSRRAYGFRKMEKPGGRGSFIRPLKTPMDRPSHSFGNPRYIQMYILFVVGGRIPSIS